jgi:dihydroxyacetone kinase-like predicted kinase
MPAVEVMDGDVVRLWFRLAADALGRTRTAIDMLNVFPVPDSDTGTNLHRTISSAADAVTILPAQASAAEVWQAAATAALVGACGNSGIIVSQLVRGLADTCGPASPCDGPVMAAGLAKAAALARAAVQRPLEGTVLTVADSAARAAERATRLPEVATAAAAGARQALARTRHQIDVLADCGVVDAGGAGLCILLDALSAAIGGTHPQTYEVPAPAHAAASRRQGPARPPEATPQYEVTFLIEAAEQAIADLRTHLSELGDSVVVSGRDGLWHVHVHVADAGAAIEAGLAVGRPSKLTIDYLNAAPLAAAAPAPASANGVVAVADGAGLGRILTQAGATVVAADDAMAAVDELVRIGQPATLITQSGPVTRHWPPGWPVIEVECLVQSLATVAVHDAGNDQAADLAAMRRAAAGVCCVSLVAGDRFTGWIAGRLAAAGDEQISVAIELADQLLAVQPEMITVLTGQDADPGLDAAVAAHIATAAPSCEVACYDGGMTSVVLLIGAE